VTVFFVFGFYARKQLYCFSAS